MQDPQIVFNKLTSGLPKFSDGRINFTGVRKAPVLNVIVLHNDKILIVKRSDKVSAYKGLWNCVSGFIDEPKSIEDFAKQELSEELGIKEEIIHTIKIKEPYEVHDKSIDRIWYVFPVLAQMKKFPNIRLDWEHTDHEWIEPNDLAGFKHVIDLDKTIKRALA